MIPYHFPSQTNVPLVFSAQKVATLFAAVASVSAFAPAPQFGMTRTSLNAFEYGKYDEILWDNEAKNDVYGSWDPSTPRSTQNFNPFETYKGNSPDASGIYPGEPRYKDPVRPEVNFAIMMAEREEAEKRAANPKAGDAPGAAGCKN